MEKTKDYSKDYTRLSPAELDVILESYDEEQLRHLLRFQLPQLGISAFNNFASNEASARSVMLGSQLSGIVANYIGDERSLISSIDREFSKASNNVIVPEDCTVIARHSKFGIANLEKGEVDIILLVRLDSTNTTSVIIVPSFVIQAPKHGYRMRWTELLNDCLPGTRLFKDDILATVPTHRANHGWAPGNEFIVAAVTHPFIIEDAGYISHQAAKKSKFSVLKELSITVHQDECVLDIYGNDEIGYKPFPLIGEQVNEYGGILGVRKFNSKQPVLMRKDNMRKPNFEKGEIFYVKEGSTVVDVEVRKGKGISNPYLDTLVDKEIASNAALISSYNRLCKNDPIDLKASNFIFRAMALNDPAIKFVAKKNFSYHIKITVCVEKYLEIGDKIANLRGGKCIISGMCDESEMPLDAYGRRVELMVGSDTVIGRMNIGMLYEQYVLAAIYNAKDMIRTAKNFAVQKQILLDLVKIFKSGQYEHYVKLSDAALATVIKEVVDNYVLQVLYDISSNIRPKALIKALKESPFAVRKAKLVDTFMGVEYKNEIITGPLYYLTIAKSPSVISSSSPKLNAFGTAVAASKENKSKTPISNNSMKQLGESDVKLYSSFVGPHIVAEIFSRNSDLEVMRHITKNLLTVSHPTNIPLLVDRSKFAYGGGASGKMMDKIMAASGTTWTYTPDKQYPKGS